MTDIVVIYRRGDLLCSYNRLLGHAASTVTYHESQVFSSLKSLLPILSLLYAFEYLYIYYSIAIRTCLGPVLCVYIAANTRSLTHH